MSTSRTPASDRARKDREREFHDDRYLDDDRESVGRFYRVAAPSLEVYERRLFELSRPGGQVLEYGCGTGSAAFDLAGRGREVVGIDISPVAIEAARDRAASLDLTTAAFTAMDAEALQADDRSFDLVCGSGILHHLELAAAYPEVARVLRPDGAAVFYEPLAYNPAVNAFRKVTPELRTVDEHPLRRSDLVSARQWFGHVQARTFHLFDLAGGLLGERPSARVVTRVGAAVDRAVLRVPGVRWMAWVVIVELARPLPAGRAEGAG
jgi:SAM-dependent methyltransferase